MSHQIIFKDQPTVEWQEALPLGNGKFGVQIYSSATGLNLSFNHYDLYYEEVAKPKDFSKSQTYAEKVAKISQWTDDFRYDNNYIYAQNPVPDDFSPLYTGTVMPKMGTGELIFQPGVVLESLILNLDEGVIELTATNTNLTGTEQKNDDAHQPTLTCEFLVTPNDQLLIHSEHLADIFACARFSFLPDAPSHSLQTNKKKGEVSSDGHVATLQSSFSAVVMMSTHSFEGQFSKEATEVAYTFLNQSRPTHWDVAQKANQKKWHTFWQSSVALPDKMLENLWFLYNYVLKISSGAGSRYFKEACGLNGLWNVHHETLWGSMWYWDVNIQAAFWGAASSGHLELLHQFNESYLAHEADIKNYSAHVYGSTNWALDYPHMFYNCIQPWCAQFLIEEYDYTADPTFLAKILPVLRAQCAFVVDHFLQKDGTVNIPYDISPEQGPLTENSTVTLVCLRYLFKRTLEFLPDAPDRFKQFYHALPDYAQTPKRLLDSPHTRPMQWLRHPSQLMPIFPLREENYLPGGKNFAQAKNTAEFVLNHCEVGMFGFGWIASAFATLGCGDEAIYALYEKGIDQWMHTNGLPFEESERFVNLTILTKPPLYLPAMMEPMGELTRSINELLFHSECGTLNLFPALPKGKTFAPKSSFAFEKVDEQFTTTAWTDASFTNLAMKGGHRISAEVVDGKLIALKIKAGSTENVALHCGVPENNKFAPLSTVLHLKKGQTFSWGVFSAEKPAPALEPLAPLVHISQTHRHIFLGKNKQTAYFKAMDAFMCPYLMGNTYQYPATVLKFDFGTATTEKNYTDVFFRQINLAVPQRILATTYLRIDAQNIFDGKQGFLIGSPKHVEKSVGVDSLRQDTLTGQNKDIFALEMPQGKYSLLFGVGGTEQATQTKITINGFTQVVTCAPQEHITLEWPLMHTGGRLGINISPGEKEPWCLNFLLVNKERSTY